MSDLKRVKELAAALVDAQADEKELERKYKDAKARRMDMEREDLPELMREIGLEEIRLDDGTVVAVRDEIDAAITEARKAAAFAWLREKGYDGIIKTELSVMFGKGEAEDAAKMFRLISEADPDHEAMLSETVHNATLKSFLKERLAAGEAVPMDVFGVHPYSKATIKKRGK